MALQLRCLWGGLTVQHNKLIARLHWQSGQHSEVLQYCQRAGSYADVAAHLTRQLALSQQQAERRSALHGSDGLRLQVRHCLSHVFSVPFFWPRLARLFHPCHMLGDDNVIEERLDLILSRTEYHF